MKHYYCLLLLLLSCLGACTERGVDPASRTREQQARYEQTIRHTLDSLFALALENPIEAERGVNRLFSSGYEAEGGGQIAIPDVHTERAYLDQAILLSTQLHRLERELLVSKYDQIRSVVLSRVNPETNGPETLEFAPTDPGLIYAQIEKLYAMLKRFRAQPLASRYPEKLQILEDFIRKKGQAMIDDRLKTHKEITGRESLLLGKEWSLMGYERTGESYIPVYTPKGPTKMPLRFQPKHQVGFDSIEIADLYYSFPYQYPFGQLLKDAVVSRGHGRDHAMHTVGQSLTGRAYYSLGDKYFVLLVEMTPDQEGRQYTVMLSLEYDQAHLQKSGGREYLPVIDEPSESYRENMGGTMGNAHAYQTLLLDGKHLGTGSYIYEYNGRDWTPPFGFTRGVAQ
jgi:hypothetical protein